MLKRVKELSGVAALTLLAGGALAQGGGAVAGARPAQATQITIKDSTGRVMVIRGNSALIDSLIKRANNLPVGSAEYLAIDSAITAAMREVPRPTASGVVYGEFHIDVSAPRAVLRFSPTDVVPQGTLGFTAEAYNRTWYSPVGQYLQYFEYPTIVAIEANSPAARAGVRSGDSVMAYNGLDLRRQAINLSQLLTPGNEVSVRLRRDGDSRDVLVPVEKAPERLIAERRADAVQSMAMEAQAQDRRIFEERVAATRVPGSAPNAVQGAPVAKAQGGGGGFGGGGVATARAVAPAYAPQMRGVLGAAMTDVEPGLAAAIRGMEGKRGVLVTVVPDGSFAFRTGLRQGDVILKAEAAEVATVAQLSVRLYLADQTAERVRLTVLRAGKILELTYAPR